MNVGIMLLLSLIKWLAKTEKNLSYYANVLIRILYILLLKYKIEYLILLTNAIGNCRAGTTSDICLIWFLNRENGIKQQMSTL